MRSIHQLFVYVCVPCRAFKNIYCKHLNLLGASQSIHKKVEAGSLNNMTHGGPSLCHAEDRFWFLCCFGNQQGAGREESAGMVRFPEKNTRKAKVFEQNLPDFMIFMCHTTVSPCKPMIPMRQSTGSIHHLSTGLGSVSQPCTSGAHCRAQALRMSERCTDIHRLQLVSFPHASERIGV